MGLDSAIATLRAENRRNLPDRADIVRDVEVIDGAHHTYVPTLVANDVPCRVGVAAASESNVLSEADQQLSSKPVVVIFDLDAPVKDGDTLVVRNALGGWKRTLKGARLAGRTAATIMLRVFCFEIGADGGILRQS